MKNKELIIKHIEKHYNPHDIAYKDIILLSKLFNIHEKSIVALIDVHFKLGFKCSDIFDLNNYCGCDMKPITSVFKYSIPVKTYYDLYDY